MPPSQAILVVEDEPSIADNILFALEKDGFEAVWVRLGNDAIAAVRKGRVDLVVLDVGLPDRTGFEVCKSIRAFSTVPILFLTARSEEIDRVLGLEIGGDDYVAKPFSPRELVARVKAILKRTTTAHLEATRTVASSTALFVVDETRRKISYVGTPLQLARYEYLLLKALILQPERVFSREQLMNQVWDSPDSSLERTVDAHIKSLRAKLRAVREGKDPITTHRGFGYSIVVEER